MQDSSSQDRRVGPDAGPDGQDPTGPASPAPGRELDALVAEKVMGWRPWSGGYYYGSADGQVMVCLHENDGMARYWSPSTDIAAAWRVVERLHTGRTFGLDWLGFDGEEWRCCFGWSENDDHLGFHHAEAATAPLAICLAALKAVGT